MSGPWTREDWNEIIRRVNQLAENPDPGCQPESTLEEVGPDHIWSKSDIRQVHDLLKRICGDNEFEDIPDLWKQSIIDEINEAIDRGWCDCCEPILCPFGTELYGSESYTQIDLGWSLDWTSPNYPWHYRGAVHTMNWAPLINGMQVIEPGYQRAWWRVRRWEPLHDYYAGGYRVFPTGSSGIVECDGKIVANMDTEGPLGMRFAPDGSHTLVLQLSCVNVGVASIDGEQFDGKPVVLPTPMETVSMATLRCTGRAELRFSPSHRSVQQPNGQNLRQPSEVRRL